MRTTSPTPFTGDTGNKRPRRGPGGKHTEGWAQSQYLATASHELKSPLTSMLLLSRILADNEEGNLTPEQVKFARTIYSSGERLLELINDILDFAKVEAGHTGVLPEEVRLATVVLDMHELFDVQAEKAGVWLTIEIAPGAPLVLVTDRALLERILVNFLSNALKFTARGGRVDLRLAGDAHGVVFRVADTGIGMSPEGIAGLFKPFQQGPTSHRSGGTGLGLAISKNLALLLRGDIVVSSEEGRGSEFTLVLPAVWPAPSRPAPRR